MKQRIEEPFFFKNESSKLFGILHIPHPGNHTKNIEKKKQGFVFCHPFAEEKAISHRVMVNFARFLCQHGYHVLRFDYRGCGDSENDFEEANLTTRLSDIRKAIGELHRLAEVNFVCLFGLRLGATLAALTAETDNRVQQLILWEPIVKVREYFFQFIRMRLIADNFREGLTAVTREQLLQNLKKGNCVDILGYMLSPKCFEEFNNVDLLDHAGRTLKNALIVAIMNRYRYRKDLEMLLDVYKSHKTPVQVLYVQERRFWIDPNNFIRELASWRGHESLFQQTLKWLEA
ncbi:MAG: hypothetical protein BA863_18215 [Desulfovibrio sp. S3730MH75]|nr:MAG: hypothetical protein BA863_18215 [Desulfovibrio sp. S3730MH75]